MADSRRQLFSFLVEKIGERSKKKSSVISKIYAESEHVARRKVLCSYLSRGYQVLRIRPALPGVDTV